MGKVSYISVNLNKETETLLKKELIDMGVQPATQYPFHITMMYDERELDKPLCDINPDAYFKATILGFKILGDAIVAELHSNGLHNEHRRLKEAGYVHSFPNLLLHMSLVYDPTDYDLVKIQTKMSDWIGTEIEFTHEHIR